jgi:MFS family permease
MALVSAPLSGRMVGSRGPRLPLLLAGLATTASGVMFAALDATASDAKLFTAYVLFGIGFGFVNAPITNTAVSGMPRTQAGVAAAVASTSRQVGQSLGVAVLGAALAAGLDLTAWWIVTGCGVAILALGWLTSGHWAAGTAARAAAQFSEEAAREPVGVR